MALVAVGGQLDGPGVDEDAVEGEIADFDVTGVVVDVEVPASVVAIVA